MVGIFVMRWKGIAHQHYSSPGYPGGAGGLWYQHLDSGLPVVRPLWRACWGWGPGLGWHFYWWSKQRSHRFEKANAAGAGDSPINNNNFHILQAAVGYSTHKYHCTPC